MTGTIPITRDTLKEAGFALDTLGSIHAIRSMDTERRVIVAYNDGRASILVLQKNRTRLIVDGLRIYSIEELEYLISRI